LKPIIGMQPIISEISEILTRCQHTTIKIVVRIGDSIQRSQLLFVDMTKTNDASVIGRQYRVQTRQFHFQVCAQWIFLITTKKNVSRHLLKVTMEPLWKQVEHTIQKIAEPLGETKGQHCRCLQPGVCENDIVNTWRPSIGGRPLAMLEMKIVQIAQMIREQDIIFLKVLP